MRIAYAGRRGIGKKGFDCGSARADVRPDPISDDCLLFSRFYAFQLFTGYVGMFLHPGFTCLASHGTGLATA